MSRCLFKVPTDVVPLASDFAQWRARRPSPRSRLPDELMKRALVAARKYSAAIVARSVGLDVRQLTSKMADGSVTATPQLAKSPAAAVVRLAPVIGLHAATQSGVVVEVEAPTGWRMRVSGGDAPAAVKTFMEALR